MATSKLLLDDYPILVLPQLAVKIGLDEAIILQQVHTQINMNGLRIPQIDKHRVHFQKNGGEGRPQNKWWIVRGDEDLCREYPWWHIGIIKQGFDRLVRMGVLIHSPNVIPGLEWYTIDYENLAKLIEPEGAS